MSYEKAKKSPIGTVKTVKCEHCGIYIEKSQAIQQEGKYFCSYEHQDGDN